MHHGPHGLDHRHGAVGAEDVAAHVDAGGAFSHPLSLVEGPNPIHVIATDSVGHETALQRTAILDTVPPEISVTVAGQPLADGLLVNAPLTPEVAASDASEVTFTVLLNGAPFALGTAVADEGSYLLAVTATDAAGNVASLERSFTIDRRPPALSGLRRHLHERERPAVDTRTRHRLLAPVDERTAHDAPTRGHCDRQLARRSRLPQSEREHAIAPNEPLELGRIARQREIEPRGGRHDRDVALVRQVEDALDERSELLGRAR